MSTHRATEARTTSGKLVVSLGVVGAAAAVAGMGTFGTFTSTTSGSEAVSSGTVAIALGGGTNGVNNLTVAASNTVAGDTIQRRVDLANTGNADLAGVTLTTASTATTPTKLTTDATNGLQLRIDSCAQAWTQATTTSAATCGAAGGAVTVLAGKSAVGANVSVGTTRALPAGATDNLLVTLTLPQAADNTFQTLTDGVRFDFTGTQRTATSR